MNSNSDNNNDRGNHAGAADHGGNAATLVQPPPAAQQAKPKPRPRSQTDTKPKQPWLWNVVLLDDDDHTYDYVIRMMQNVFAQPIARAFKTAQTVDSDGRVVCLTTHKEHAELKRDQILAFGRDPLMMRSKGSMSAIIEPAEFSGDDADDNENNNNDHRGGDGRTNPRA